MAVEVKIVFQDLRRRREVESRRLATVKVLL